MSAVELSVSVPSLRAFRFSDGGCREAVKVHHVLGRVETGHCAWWGRGRVWRSGPGTVLVKEPGDVHRALGHGEATSSIFVVLPDADIARVRQAGKVSPSAQFEPGDARAAPFHRLLDAVQAGADRLSMEVVLAEALGSFARLPAADPAHSRPVRRAVEYLRAKLADAVTLDELAAHAGVDKFSLCRAFRAQVGMPPYAYLTHLRVLRAKSLLAEGVRASEVAARVGLYDQSQLNRHFRRIVGTTPGRYGASLGHTL